MELVRWAGQFGEHTFAVEDCRHLSRRLERDLLAAGETLVRVHPKLMARVRRSAREQGKSDPIDATSVARAAQREENLPTAGLTDPSGRPAPCRPSRRPSQRAHEVPEPAALAPP